MTTNKDNKIQDLKSPKTTGHEWDGISEYNVPAPRWWLIVWLVTIVWSIIFWFFYPTWPTVSGNSKGSLGWTQYTQLKESQEEIDKIRDKYFKEISTKSFKEIMADEELMEFALNGGRAAFKENCAACHGSGAQGFKGYPNLNDDDWLWGGTIDDIYTTLLYGIRASHEKTRFNQMPSFGMDKILTKKEIDDVAEYVLSLSDKAAKTNKIGQKIFSENCVACHGADGKGNQALGAPNLTDKIWLYGSEMDDLRYTIYYSRAGLMPHWKDRLSDPVIKQLSIYVHSLGGGK